jgi:hypothetical protein
MQTSGHGRSAPTPANPTSEQPRRLLHCPTHLTRPARTHRPLPQTTQSRTPDAGQNTDTQACSFVNPVVSTSSSTARGVGFRRMALWRVSDEVQRVAVDRDRRKSPRFASPAAAAASAPFLSIVGIPVPRKHGFRVSSRRLALRHLGPRVHRRPGSCRCSCAAALPPKGRTAPAPGSPRSRFEVRRGAQRDRSSRGECLQHQSGSRRTGCAGKSARGEWRSVSAEAARTSRRHGEDASWSS